MLTLRHILRTGAALCSFRRKVLFEGGLDDPWPNAAAIPVTWRFGGEADLRRMTVPELGYSAEARDFGLERLRAGDRFVLCESEGRVVFYAWVMFGQLDLSCRNYVPLAANVAYTYKLYTVPASRGQRICPAYYSFLKRELRARGFRRVMAWVEAGNKPSIRAHQRSGLRPVGTIWHFRLLARAYFLLPKSIQGRTPDPGRTPARGTAPGARQASGTSCDY
jgi:L-amino acid N-acyltransferase YncA